VATAEAYRRQGIATRLVDQVEAGLRDLGCPKVSVLIRDENDDGREFWVARGYDKGSRQFARELRND
jgi:ribosomal protein S18 acetylase RimI-like enzyme